MRMLPLVWELERGGGCFPSLGAGGGRGGVGASGITTIAEYRSHWGVAGEAMRVWE